MAYNYEYPYTDPYRYNDDWLLRKMKDLIEEWAAMKKQFADLQTAFNDLKTYVMNYFQNLDVQEEINNKLDQMLTSGEFNQYFTIPMQKIAYGTNYGNHFTGRIGLFVGNGFFDSADSLGRPLYNVLGNVFGCAEVFNLSNPNASLTGNNVTYAQMVNEWLSTHNSIAYKVGPIFFVLAHSDRNATTQQIASGAHALYANFPAGVFPYLICPPPPSSFTPDSSGFNIFDFYKYVNYGLDNIYFFKINFDLDGWCNNPIYNTGYNTLTSDGVDWVASYLKKKIQPFTTNNMHYRTLSSDKNINGTFYYASPGIGHLTVTIHAQTGDQDITLTFPALLNLTTLPITTVVYDDTRTAWALTKSNNVIILHRPSPLTSPSDIYINLPLTLNLPYIALP